MPTSAGGNDFNLEFTSNAKAFGQQLGTSLDSPIAKIEELRAALVQYDEQVGKMSRKGPLADQFAGLNLAAEKMQSAADALVRGVAASLNGLQSKITALAETLAGVGRGLGVEGAGVAAGEVPAARGPYTMAAGTQAEVDALEARKRAASQTKRVTEEEIASSKDTVAASGKIASANAKMATSATELATTVQTLVGTLQTLAERVGAINVPKAGGGRTPPAAGEISGEVQVGNTQANPVPVVVVGGDPSIGGHPAKEGGLKPPTKATTETSNAAAVQALTIPARPRSAEQWDALTPAYRSRLERSGVTRGDYLAGVPLGAARGHGDATLGAANAGVGAPGGPTNAAAVGALGSGNEPAVNRTAPPSLPYANRVVTNATQAQLNALDQSTREYITTIRAKLAALAGKVGPEVEAQRQQLIAEAGAAFKLDSQVRPGRTFNRDLFGTAPVRSAFLGDALGLDVSDPKIQKYLQQEVLRSGRSADQATGLIGGRKAGAGTAGAGIADEEAVSQVEAAGMARVNEILATSSGKVREALLSEARALTALNRLKVSGVASSEQLAQAEINASQASRRAAEAQRGSVDAFGSNLAKTGGWALRHTIAYTLVFTGYEKLKEVVHTGIEAQASMIRLNASLQATGKSTEGVSDAMARISSNTGTPIQHVIDAASELAGVFKDTAHLEFATNIAAQLSNISQGVLNTTEASIGLRDVIAAFGLKSKDDLQNIGDLIAHLSQTTGVNVQDITKGTTQLAQEGRDFGLSPRQTATLAAYITQGTGEPGEQAAEQASRMLSTLYSPRVQQTLVRNGITDQSKFLQGNIAGVLEDLVSKWDKLNPSTRQQVANLVGSGRQARAFAAATSGGEAFVSDFKGSNLTIDKGSLGAQNAAFMQSLLGQLKRLSEDFQNLGVSIQRSGLLDLLGALVTMLDKVARATQILVGGFSNLADKSNVGHDLAHVGVALLEIYGIARLLGKTGIGAGIGAGIRSVPGRAAALARNEQYVAPVAATSAATSAESAATVAANEMTQAHLRAAAAANRVTASMGRTAAAATEDVAATNADIRAKLDDVVATEENAAAQRSGALGGATGGRGPRGRLLSAGLGAGLFIGGSMLGESLTEHGHKTAGSTVSGAATGALLGSFIGPEGTLIGAGIGAIAGFASGQGNGNGQFKDYIKNIPRISDAGKDFKKIAQEGGDGTADSLKATAAAYLEQTKLEEKAKKSGVTTDDLTRAITGSGKAYDEVVAKWKAGGSPNALTIKSLHDLRDAFMQSGAAAAMHAEKVSLSNGAMNQAQATLAQAYAGGVGGLSPDTLRQFPEATKALLGNSGTIIGTPQYKNAATLAGYNVVPPSATELKDYQLRKDAYDLAQKQYTQQKGRYDAAAAQVAKSPENAFNSLSKSQQADINSKVDDKFGAAYTAANNKGVAGQADAKQISATAQKYANGLIIQAMTGVGRAPTAPGATGPQRPLDRLVRTNVSPVQQARALEGLLRKPIETDTDIVNNIDPTTKKSKSYSAEAITTAVSSLNTLLSQVQQARQQAYQIPIAVAQSRSTAQANMGDFAGAANALKAQKAALQNYLSTLKPNQQEYWQTLDQIFAVENQITTTLATPQMQKLQIVAANSLNPAAAAAAQYQLAQIELENAQKAYEQEVQDAADVLAKAQAALDAYLASWDGHARGSQLAKIAALQGDQKKAKGVLDGLKAIFGNTPQEQQGKVDLASAGASQADVAESEAEARAQANMAGIRNTASQARAQIGEAARQAAVYASRGDQAKYYQAIAQEQQAEIQLRDALEAQSESARKASAALLTRKGDAVGAAREDLGTAQMAYNYAVNQYGQGSQQAMDALAAMYQAQSTEIAAELAKQNADLELSIAKLNFRGGAGDAERVAQDQLREAQNALNSYLKHGGKKNTTQYDQLQGAILNAKRNAIDTAVNAQIDTLDFQRETYKITSSQEVRALQQILKNKQLTLAEQRSITLKIKDLQTSIREQLTQGGLNIPSDIKLPTAYEVRRSLGAGFGGSSTQVNTVNNRNVVQITNTVPNAQVAADIAASVVKLINQQTGAQIRANSSTPRLVSTR